MPLVAVPLFLAFLAVLAATAGGAPAGQPAGAPAAPSTGSGPSPSDLLAHGNAHAGDELFWVARVTGNDASVSPGSYTRFFAVRASDSRWQQWGDPVPSRAVSMASRGAQLAVLMEDGSWILLSDDNSVSTGQRLPVPGADLITFADDRRNVWAVAKVPGGYARLRPSAATTLGTSASAAPAVGPMTGTSGPSSEPSTNPSSISLLTRPASAAAALTQPSTLVSEPVAVTPMAPTPVAGPAVVGAAPAAAPEMALTLVSLSPDGWVGEAEIPGKVAGPGDEVSLALIDDEPYLAARAPEARAPVRLFRLLDDHQSASKAPAGRPSDKWAAVRTIKLPDDVQGFKLLNGTPVPTIWARGGTGPDLLYLCRLNPNGLVSPTPEPVPLESTRGAPANLRTAAYALGLIRCIFSRDGDLYEQSCDRLTGAPAGKAAPLALPSTMTIPLTLWRYAVVTGAMLFAIGASFRRREQLRSLKIDPDALPLAPMGARLLAGSIDALPVIAAWVFYYQRMGFPQLVGAITGSAAVAEPLVEISLWASFAVYFLHTCISELVMGRTLGKILVGLRVVSVDGRPPTRGQMVTRNFLRVIDAGLIFLPLMLVPFSPLRQRAGDTAAGTVVISAKPRQSKDEGEVRG